VPHDGDMTTEELGASPTPQQEQQEQEQPQQQQEDEQQQQQQQQQRCKPRSILIAGVIIVIAMVAIILPSVLVPNNNNSKEESTNYAGGEDAAASNAATSNAPSAASTQILAPSPTTPALTIFGSFELLESVPHDAGAFTQGLELVEDSDPLLYYETTGLFGQSSVRIVNLASGQVVRQHNMERAYFGEGMTYHDGKLVQITWRSGTGFVYDANNLEVLEEFTYETTNGEGWGICSVASQNVFYVSDGTSFLHTWDTASFQLMNKVAVKLRTAEAGEQLVSRLNELEWDPFSETVLANVWQQNYIVRIDPLTGFVTHRYDMQSLSRPANANVLNGIAHTNIPNEFWVTGKLWPNMYRVRLIQE
jgi:glutamine cyclotransferase